MAQQARCQRIADQIQRELASLVQFELKDPRIGMLTISGAKVSRDISTAEIYVTKLGENSEDDIRQTLAVLNKASGFLRKQLGQNMRLRQVPQLRFHYDDTAFNGQRMSKLIDYAIDQDKNLSSAKGPQSE